MIKITNEIDGKKYEFVTESNNSKHCAFNKSGGCDCTDEQSTFDDIVLCCRLDGIWKEVRDAD
jgi:hypothetical protein